MSNPTTPPVPEAFHIARDTPDWHAAWDALGDELRNRGLGDGHDLRQQAGDGEIWEYHGSRASGGILWSHSFRHRNHPKTHRRESFDVVVCDLEEGEA